MELLRRKRHTIIDIGTSNDQPVDYPDYAKTMAAVIRNGRAERGIFLCGSGVGAAIAANKFRGIRAAVCHDCFSARQAVEDDDANILCLGTRVIGPGLALELVQIYLASRFSGAARHKRRLAKIERFEKGDAASRR